MIIRKVKRFMLEGGIFLFMVMGTQLLKAGLGDSLILKSKTIIELYGRKHVLLKGELLVPEDRSKPEGKLLRLPVQVIKASVSVDAEPVFWLDGGPGASNILKLNKIKVARQQQLMEHHDFVCVGYRGVDGTVKLRSKKINKAFKGSGHRLLSDRSLDKVEQEIRTYVTRLKDNGVNINSYTIMDVMEDMESARLALGYKKINLIAVSYGTRVAQVYAYKYPDALKRVVMIGVSPPGSFLVKADQTQRALYQYDSLYQALVAGRDTHVIMKAMQKAFERMPRRWSVFRLDADKIKAGTTGALYARGFAVWACNAYLSAAYLNDYRGLFLLQKLYDQTTRACIGDMYAKTVSADMRTDVQGPFFSRNELRHTTTLLGNNVAVIYGSTAHLWNIRSIPEVYKTARFTDVETLLVSGELDFRTPPGLTEKELMPFMKRGRHVVLTGMSHSDILQSVMKSTHFLYKYLEEGKVDVSLVDPLPPVDFRPAKPMSKLKLFVIGLVL